MLCPIVQSLCNRLNQAAGDDANVHRLIGKFRARSEAGLKKYGTTLARTDLTQEDWLNHAQQEAMDLANYLEVLILAGMSSLIEAQSQAITIASDIEARLSRLSSLSTKH